MKGKRGTPGAVVGAVVDDAGSDEGEAEDDEDESEAEVDAGGVTDAEAAEHKRKARLLVRPIRTKQNKKRNR